MQRIKHEAGGAGIDFTRTGLEDKDRVQTRVELTPLGWDRECLRYASSSPEALKERVAIVDKAISRNIKWG